MKHILFALALALCSCSADQTMDTIETTSEKLQPVVEGWKKICQTGQGCLEGAGEDTAELEKTCEEGWKVFQLLQVIQEMTIRAVGGEPCQDGCSQ